MKPCPHCGKPMGSLWGPAKPRMTWKQFLGKIAETKRSMTLKEISELTKSPRGNSWNRLQRLKAWGMAKVEKVGDKVLWSVTDYGIKVGRG